MKKCPENKGEWTYLDAWFQSSQTQKQLDPIALGMCEGRAPWWKPMYGGTKMSTHGRQADKLTQGARARISFT